PKPIRITLQDPLDKTGFASGLDIQRTIVTLEGPLGSAQTGPTVTGTIVPFDPQTIDFTPLQPLTQDGTYRVHVTPVDTVGNVGPVANSDFILDPTPIKLVPGLITCTPADGAAVSPATIPGGAAAPFVTVSVNSPDFSPQRSLLEVDDFCRAPPKVP